MHKLLANLKVFISVTDFLVDLSLNVAGEEIKKNNEKDQETHHSRIHREALQIAFPTSSPDPAMELPLIIHGFVTALYTCFMSINRYLLQGGIFFFSKIVVRLFYNRAPLEPPLPSGLALDGSSSPTMMADLQTSV